MTTETKTFVVSFNVSYSVDVYVERPANITKDELQKSLTRDEVFTAADDNEMAPYEGLKSAWRDNNCVIYETDEVGSCDWTEAEFDNA